jgi:DNA-binding NtrC family response regulator
MHLYLSCYSNTVDRWDSWIARDGRMVQKRILLVEDNLHVAQGLNRLLVLLGYHVECCDSSELALAKLKEIPFDLVISDLRLPGMSGLDLLERVRCAQPAMQSILITAFHSPEIQSQAHRWANAYLSKPFEMQQFAQAVEQVLQATSEGDHKPESNGIPNAEGMLPENGQG